LRDEERSLLEILRRHHHRFGGIVDLIEDDRINFHADVIVRDDTLLRHVERDHAQIDAIEAIDDRDDEGQARPSQLPQAPQPQDHTAFPFAQHFDRDGEECVAVKG